MKIHINHIKGCFDEFEANGICSFTLTDATEGRFTHAEALKYASAKGMRLLTKNEMHILVGAGVLKRGDKSFWSSSVRAGNRNDAWRFDGDFGNIYDGSRNVAYAVRCVSQLTKDK